MPQEKKSDRAAFRHIEKECTDAVREAYTATVESSLAARGFTLVSYLDDAFDADVAEKIRDARSRGVGPLSIVSKDFDFVPDTIDSIEIVEHYMIPDLVLKNSEGEYSATIVAIGDAVVQVRDEEIYDEMMQLATEWGKKRPALGKNLTEEMVQCAFDFQEEVAIVTDY